MENIYIYDESFYGLLYLIIELLKRDIKPANICKESYHMSIFDNIINLKIEDDKNEINKLINKIGKINFKVVFYVFLSEDKNKELIIYYYIKNAIKYGNKVVYLKNLKCVDKALKIERCVSREAHRFKGFTRFKELANHILYAEINPDNNILVIISKHFKIRLKNQYWIIKDVNRHNYSIYDKKKFYLVTEEEFELLNIDVVKEEKEISNLWKTFYKTIGIEARKNERCRMSFMPKKYWQYILEMSDEIEKGNN